MNHYFKHSISILLFSLLLISQSVSLAQSDSLDQIVATVNGEPITETDIQRRIKYLNFELSQAGDNFLPANAARQTAVRREITYRLQLQEARRWNFNITQEDVINQLVGISEQLGLTANEFLELMGSFGLNRSEIERFAFETLLGDLLLENAIIPRVQVREDEVDRYLNVNSIEIDPTDEYNLAIIAISVIHTMKAQKIQQLRQIALEVESALKRNIPFRQIANSLPNVEGIESGDIGWTQLSDIGSELASELSIEKVGKTIGPIKIQNNTIFAHVNSHRLRDAKLPEIQQFHVSRIFLNASNEAGVEVITEKLEELRQNIADGADFASLARLHSRDTTTKSKGGDLGWISEDNLPFEYLRLLSEMDTDDVSPVQRTGNSVYILQLHGIRLADEEERKRSLVRSQLRNNKLRQERTLWIDQLYATADIDFRTIY